MYWAFVGLLEEVVFFVIDLLEDGWERCHNILAWCGKIFPYI